MIPESVANVSVQINEEAIRKHIQNELDKQIHQNLIFVDLNKLSEMTSSSKRWLEDELLTHPRIKLCERRKNRKRLWVMPDVMEAIKEVAETW